MNSMKKKDYYNDIKKFAVLKFMLFSFQVSGSFRTTSSKKIKVSKPEKVKTLKISKVFQKEWLLPRKKQSTILPWTMSFQLSEDLISGNQWMTNFSLISNTWWKANLLLQVNIIFDFLLKMDLQYYQNISKLWISIDFLWICSSSSFQKCGYPILG